MAELRIRIFTGVDKDDAVAQLNASLIDGSWPLIRWQGYPVLWITPEEVIPGTMQRSSYKLHVTAWVETESPDAGSS